MKTVQQALKGAMTQIEGNQAVPMHQKQGTLQTWAEWLGVETFGDYSIEEMVRTTANWANAIKAGMAPHWITFMGTSGAGKTMICDRIWGWVQNRPNFNHTGLDYYPSKVYWPDFVDKLRDGNAYDQYNDMKRWPFLYLDDVWADRQTEFSSEKLSTLLGCRMDQWTIMTANATMQAIAENDVRISSRIIRDGNRFVIVKTKDYHMRQSA